MVQFTSITTRISLEENCYRVNLNFMMNLINSIMELKEWLLFIRTVKF